MNSLSLLACLALANNKQLREAASPEDFGKLASLVERLKADVPGTLQGILRDEAGVEWDGTAGTCWDTVVQSCKRQAEIDRLLAEFDAEQMRRLTARKALQFPSIAGKTGVDKAIVTLQTTSIDKRNTT